jgi:hypothetical protein
MSEIDILSWQNLEVFQRGAGEGLAAEGGYQSGA